MEDGRKKRVPFEVIDLTQKLSNKTASWDGTCGFSHKILVNMKNALLKQNFSYKVSKCKRELALTWTLLPIV